jgi:phosphinothricin acetyltransferase
LLYEDGGEVLGYVYATQHRERAAYRWSVDTTVYVRQGRQRRGVGRALYTSLLAALPLQGYVNAYAGVTLPNPASVGLHEAVGFLPVGVYSRVGFKCGAWHDVAWFQRPLGPRPEGPPPPAPLEEVRETAAWAAALHAGLRPLPADPGPAPAAESFPSNRSHAAARAQGAAERGIQSGRKQMRTPP